MFTNQLDGPRSGFAARHNVLASVTALVLAVVLSLTSCQGGVPETAGNRVIGFGFDLETDLAVAYGQLCSGVRNSVPLASFERSRGADVSAVLVSDSWIMTRNEAVPDYLTQDPSLTATWTELEVRWPPEGSIPAATTATEIWRVHLVREDGIWKVCRFEPAPDQSARR